MFRKLAFAATLALGMGAGVLATQSAEAAVVHPAASATLIQAIQQSGGPSSMTEQVRWHRPHRHCRWRRVHTRWGWRRQRICW